MTGEIHAEEAKRLADGQGDLQMHAESGESMRLQERVISLEHELSEVKMERDRLAKELENAKENDHNVRKALHDEIDSLKERERHLKETNSILQRGLEGQGPGGQQRSAGAQDERTSSEQEQMLILQERAAKAEEEAERMRAARELALHNEKELKSQVTERDIQLTRKEGELRSAQQALQANQNQLRQLQELNNDLQ